MLALVTTLAACDRAKNYPLTPDAAREKLVGTTIPDIAFGKSAHSGPGQATVDGVQWAIERGSADGLGDGSSDGRGDDATVDAGTTVMILHAKLTPVAGGTEATVDLAAPPGGNPAKLQLLSDQHRATVGMFRSIGAEQVDSVLTARPFRFANISGNMVLAVMSELPAIRRQLNEAANASDERDRDTMHRAYDAAK